MDICSQYSRYMRHCARFHTQPQSFARFVIDVFPFTVFP